MSIDKKIVDLYEKYNKFEFHNLSLLDLSKLEQKLMLLNKNFISLVEANKCSKEQKLINFYITNIYKKLKEIRLFYLSQLEQLYNVKIDKENFLENHKKQIKKDGIDNFSTKKYFEGKAILDYLNTNITEKIEEEYPETRKMKRHFIIHHGDTNTGKTYKSIIALKNAKTGIYLAPLRLLALEIFQNLNYDNVPCILSTGEEEIQIPFAKHISSTIEKLDIQQEYDVGVIDEAQLIGDEERGKAWTKAILGLKAKEIHLCCSSNVVSLLKKMILSCNDTFEEEVCSRSTKLIFENKLFKFPEDVEEGDSLICFSRKNVLMYARILKEHGISASMLYGRLPPDVRRQQVELFESGKNKVVVSTDAIGMGVNLSIKRVVFLEATKYNGKCEVPLSQSEIRQIAGRAGRYGKYPEGFYITAENQDLIGSAYSTNLPEVKFAYVLPSDTVLTEFPAGNLAERLIAWKNKPSKSYYKKADITEAMFLLEDLYTFAKDKLTINDELKFIFVPFEIRDTELLEYWRECINYYIEKIPFPSPFNIIKEVCGLKEAETYYRKLDMYYAICKIFNQKIDTNKILEEKDKTSKKIMQYLEENKQEMFKRCNCCGAKLPISFKFFICNNCYKEKYKNSTKNKKSLK